MAITLQKGADILPLDEALYWSDEFDQSGVVQSVDRGLTGALILQVDGDAERPGREITLQPIDDDSGWMTHEDLQTLKEWEQLPGQQFNLTIRDVSRTVIFRSQDRPAVSAKPVVHFSDVQPGDYYLVTLKFQEV